MKSINSNIINQSNAIYGEIIKNEDLPFTDIWTISRINRELITNLNWLTLYRDQIFRETLLKVFFGLYK